MRVVIRADGGPDIGYGHLVRTSALAERIVSDGHDVVVATTTPESARSIYPDTARILDLPVRDEVDPFLNAVADPDVIVTDAYPIDVRYQRAVRTEHQLVVIQDDNSTAVCADAFVNGNIYARELEYAVCGEEPTWCLGPEYVLVRRDIAQMAAREPLCRESPEKAIITMGGSDMAELTPVIVRAFDGFDIAVEAIIGPGFSDDQEQTIRNVARDVGSQIRVTRNPDDLPRRMFEADLAVCTASSTVYELLAVGTPIVCTAVASNQETIAAALDDRDLAAVVEPAESPFRRAVDRVIQDPLLRRALTERGRDVVDGRGSKRVYGQILSLDVENEQP